MFGLFKKRNPVPSAEELHASVLQDVREKWVYFNDTIHLKADVPLSKKLDLFAQPMRQFFDAKYPFLLLGSSEIFWTTIFTAVIESGTHSKDEVNYAIAELGNKYAG